MRWLLGDEIMCEVRGMRGGLSFMRGSMGSGAEVGFKVKHKRAS